VQQANGALKRMVTSLRNVYFGNTKENSTTINLETSFSWWGTSKCERNKTVFEKRERCHVCQPNGGLSSCSSAAVTSWISTAQSLILQKSMERYIEYLKMKSNVQWCVVIMRVLPRKLPLRYRIKITIEEYKRKVQHTNGALKRMATSLPNVFFRQHDRRLNNPKLLSYDGAHLNVNRSKRYWKSVRGAVMFAVRFWTS